MSLIQVSNLTFCYEGSCDNIFENVSFQIDTDWRLDLTGRNGRGKTTLLRLLQGMYPHRGTIRASVGFDYFPYTVPDPEECPLELLPAICPEVPQWCFLRELAPLEVPEGHCTARFPRSPAGSGPEFCWPCSFPGTTASC